jgi:hypothetical protein
MIKTVTAGASGPHHGAALAIRRLGPCRPGFGRPAASASRPAQRRSPSEWRTAPPENLLVIDTTKGRVLVELTPEIAPLHVERMQAAGAQRLLRRPDRGTG